MSDKPVPITPDKLATIAAIEALREYHHETKMGEYKPALLGRIIQKHVHKVITQVRNSTLEDAAQAVKALNANYHTDSDYSWGGKDAVIDGVQAIRALKDK